MRLGLALAFVKSRITRGKDDILKTNVTAKFFTVVVLPRVAVAIGLTAFVCRADTVAHLWHGDITLPTGFINKPGNSPDSQSGEFVSPDGKLAIGYDIGWMAGVWAKRAGSIEFSERRVGNKRALFAITTGHGNPPKRAVVSFPGHDPANFYVYVRNSNDIDTLRRIALSYRVHLGRWHTANALKALLSSPDRATRVDACRKLTLTFTGQDECWSNLGIGDGAELRSHSGMISPMIGMMRHRYHQMESEDPEKWWRSAQRQYTKGELLDELKLLTADNDEKIRQKFCGLLREKYPSEIDSGCEIRQR